MTHNTHSPYTQERRASVFVIIKVFSNHLIKFIEGRKVSHHSRISQGFFHYELGQKLNKPLAHLEKNIPYEPITDYYVHIAREYVLPLDIAYIVYRDFPKKRVGALCGLISFNILFAVAE